jgi:integrase
MLEPRDVRHCRFSGALRTREHLTVDEVERLIEAAKTNRYGHRDALMVLLAFRHGLRAGEVVDLRWDQVDFNSATLHVRRLKNGTPSTHPLTGRELRGLRRHRPSKVGGMGFSDRNAVITLVKFVFQLLIETTK